MKRITLLVFGFLFTAGSCFAQNAEISLAEPVTTGDNYEVYGSEFPDNPQYFALGYLIRNSNVFKGKQVATTGTIKEVCQKKGCFFILAKGENTARITFKDYSFFVPKDAAGARAELKGIFKEKKLSEEQAKHYAEDAGRDSAEIEGDGIEYNIVASSVKIIE